MLVAMLVNKSRGRSIQNVRLMQVLGMIFFLWAGFYCDRTALNDPTEVNTSERKAQNPGGRPLSPGLVKIVTEGDILKVTGKLVSLSPNIFLHPEFYVVDEKGNQIAIIPWLPLEVPPLAPQYRGKVLQPPLTILAYLGKTVTVSGVIEKVPQILGRSERFFRQGNFVNPKKEPVFLRVSHGQLIN